MYEIVYSDTPEDHDSRVVKIRERFPDAEIKVYNDNLEIYYFGVNTNASKAEFYSWVSENIPVEDLGSYRVMLKRDPETAKKLLERVEQNRKEKAALNEKIRKLRKERTAQVCCNGAMMILFLILWHYTENAALMFLAGTFWSLYAMGIIDLINMPKEME